VATALCSNGLMTFAAGFLARARAWAERHPDAFTALFTFAGGLLLLAVGVHGLWTGTDAVRNLGLGELSPWWSLPLLVAGCGVMLVKQRHPMLALALGTALFAADAALVGSLGMLLVFFDLLYSAANWAGERARKLLMGVIVVITVASVTLPLVVGETPAVAALLGIQSIAILATPYWWGTSIRQGRELAASEAARADDAVRLADLSRDEAVREERARMARDLHDVIAANLSTVAIHSEAALSRPPDTVRDRATLDAVRRASIDGLDQMRSMIIVLRSGDDEVAAPLQLAQLGDIVSRGGLATVVVGDIPKLAVAVDQAAARIISESLANAAKHTPGARVTIEFASTDQHDVITVSSRGGTPALAAGTGHGIITMRERAERLGGTLSIDEHDGVWAVCASLPKVAS